MVSRLDGGAVGRARVTERLATRAVPLPVGSNLDCHQTFPWLPGANDVLRALQRERIVNVRYRNDFKEMEVRLHDGITYYGKWKADIGESTKSHRFNQLAIQFLYR